MFRSVWRAELLANGETAVSNTIPLPVLINTLEVLRALVNARDLQGGRRGEEVRHGGTCIWLHCTIRLGYAEILLRARDALRGNHLLPIIRNRRNNSDKLASGTQRTPQTFLTPVTVRCCPSAVLFATSHQQSLSANDSSIRTNPSLSHSDVERLTTVHKKHWPSIFWNRSELKHIL